MKTKFTYIASALISLLLCAAMLCGAILPTVADEKELPSLDYRNESIETTKTLSAYELYSMLLAQTSPEGTTQTPTEGEKLYWEGSDLCFSYTDFVPDSCIDTFYDSEKAALYITLLPYTYTAANGVEVTWIPSKLFLDGEVVAFTHDGDVYTARIADRYHSKESDLKVDYTWQVEIPLEVVSALRQDAYNQGYPAYELMKDYRQKLAIYEELVQMQNKWDAYEKWEEDYANYLVEKALYDELKAKYDAYMVEYNARQALVDARNQWDYYFAQDELFKQNEKPYEEYKTYYNAYKAAVDKLAMFDSVYLKEPRGWCMYNDIMGGTVTQVLASQDLLVAGGCNANDIHLAGQSTENLRVLLTGYNDLRTAKWASEHEKNKALYNYYVQNYEALKLNLRNLYSTLKGLYENTAVSNMLGIKGIKEHYHQLVGHLFVVSTALDENANRDENTWRIGRLTLREVIDDIHYFKDGDWDPRTTAFPEGEVPFVERIEKPVRPTVENPSYIPPAPTVVPNPGDAPAVVEDPSGTPRPQAPKPVGEKPQAPVFDQVTDQLWKDIDNGQLKRFSQYIYAETLTITKTVERQFSYRNTKTVTLYKPNGEIYKQILVDYGTGITLEPYVLEDSEGYNYEWLRWERLLPNGKKVEADTSCITENISLYPYYRSTPKVFNVTWVIDGVSHVMPCYFDVTPDPTQYLKNINREDDFYTYTFSGWDKEIGPVKGDTTYTGYTICTPKKFDVTWVLQNGEKIVTEQWEYNTMPKFDGELSYQTKNCTYKFLRWDTEVSLVTRNVTYRARYEEIPFASSATSNGIVYDVLHGDNEITVLATGKMVVMSEAARLADELGKTLTVRWEGIVSVSLSQEELKNYISTGCLPLRLLSVEDGDVTSYYFEYFDLLGIVTELPTATVQFENRTADGKALVIDIETAPNKWERTDESLVVTGGFTARLQRGYAVIPTTNEFCNFAQMVNMGVEGEWISLNLDCVHGYKIVGAKVTDENGVDIPVTNLSFQMPAAAVSVVFQVEQIIYRVTFLVDGEVWSSAEYGMGEEIVLPTDPTKVAEEGYAYTFTGWGDVPVLATGEETDLVFEASWMKSQTVSDYDSGRNNNVLFGIILPCVLVVAVLVIVFFILRKKARKMGGWHILWAKVYAVLSKWFKKVKESISKLFKKNSKKNQK